MTTALRMFGLLLAGLLGQLAAQAQTPAWQSALVLGQSGTLVHATATDASGNVYLVGEFTGAATFGNFTLTGGAGGASFVAKYQPATATFIWAQRLGSTGSPAAYAVAVSGANVYVGGVFGGAPFAFGATTLVAPAQEDAFVVKLTDTGSTASAGWAQQVSGAGYEEVNALAVSGSSIYLGGTYSSTPASFGTITLSSAGLEDAFVAKLVDGGSTSSFRWALGAGSADQDQVTSLAVSGSSVYVGGYFRSSTLTFGTTPLTNAGQADTFVAKLADAGNTASYLWAQRLGGPDDDLGYTLVAAGPSVYVGGGFISPACQVGTTVLTNVISSAYKVFVAKLTDTGSAGSFIWAQQADGTSSNEARQLAVANASVYVAGTASAGRTMFGTYTLIGSDMGDVFVAKLTDTGNTSNFAWVQQAGSTYFDAANTVVVNNATLYVTGTFDGPTATFGPITLPGGTPIARISFLAGLRDPVLAAAPATTLSGLTLYPNPAHGTATVRVPAGPAATLTLLDALGRVVRTAAAPAGQAYPLDLSGLTPGVYALRVQAGEGQVVQKLVVE